MYHRFLAVIFACLTCGTSACAVQDDSVDDTLVITQAVKTPDSGILSPTEKHHGKTYGEWGDAWWQFVVSIPTPNNPLIDPTGADCDVGQSGPVWFLVGAPILAAALFGGSLLGLQWCVNALLRPLHMQW